MSGKLSARNNTKTIVPEVLAVGVDRARKTGEERPGRTGSDVLSVYLRGGPVYELDGRRYPVVPPFAILIPAGTLDHDLQRGEVDGAFVLFRGKGLLGRAASGRTSVSASPGAPPRAVPCIRAISASRALRLHDLLGRIGAISVMDQPSLLRRAALLLEAVATYCEAERGTGPGGVHREAQRLRELIERQACRDQPMARLYREVGVSPARAAALFVRAFGLSPVAYRTQLRLTRARELLVSTRRNVSEAAWESGFSDPLYFSRAFHRHFGMAPSSLIRRFAATRRA